MRRIIVDADAEADLDAIAAYIERESPHAALRVLDRLRATFEKIAHMPTGREGRMDGTLERPVRGLPYVIAFDLPDPNTLRVLRVIHGARDWPSGEWPE